jgi:serine phosphatase RsbU (regulator of sigma subunit)
MSGRLCSAGHPPALIRRADGRVHEIGQPGTLLGIFADARLADTRFRLGPGDLLLLYTDGATESRKRKDIPPAPRPMFGQDALASALAGTRDLDAAATISHITRALALHSGNWASDDTALLAIGVPSRL